MRKGFVFFVLVPLIIAAIVVYLFIDGWVESGLETAGEAAVGARVEIDGLHLSLFPIGIRWTRMQVADPADPWRNLFETRAVRFALDAGQLLRGKYLVETMEVHELLLGTRRTTDGSLPGGKSGTPGGGTRFFTDLAREALDRSVEQTPLFNLENLRKGINPDSLVKLLDLQSVRHLETLKVQVAATARQWELVQADFDSSRRKLAEAEAALRAINPAELKTVEKIAGAVNTVESTVAGINSLKTVFETRKTAVTADVERLRGSLGAVDEIVRGDFERALALARLPSLNTDGIARLLAGQEMVRRAMTYLEYVDLARNTIQRYTPEPAYEKPPRFRGQDIAFPVERHYPRFWIRKVLVSGGTGQTRDDDFVRAEGEARNISSDQSVTGEPLTIELKGVEGGGRFFTLGALIDRRKEVPFDEYRATLGGVPLAEFRLGREDFLPASIRGARMNSSLAVTVPGDRFDARSEIALAGFTVSFGSEGRNIAERLLMDVLRGISGFEVGLRLWNSAGPVQVALTTNLDDQLARRLREVLGAELTRLQNAVRARIDQEIAARRREVERLFAERKADVEERIRALDALLQEKASLAEAKKRELAQQLEKEKKGKVDDLLKKLIR